MSDANFKVTNSESGFNPLASLQDQLASIDPETVCFFKLNLFKNTPTNYSAIHEVFTEYVSQLFKSKSNVFFARLYFIFFFQPFKQQFLDLIKEDVRKFRNRWLISHCHVNELHGLDAKSSQYYFQSFETKKVLEYISSFQSVENIIYQEYKKLRLQLLLSLLKKNSSLFIFWSVIVIFFIFYFILSASDSSFTVFQQIKVWLRFIFGKIT